MTEKVRLAVLITRLVRGGAQRIALETCRRLDRDRYERVLLTGPDLGPEGGFLDEARQAGIHPIRVPSLHREIRPAEDVAALLWLRSFLRRHRIDLLHTHTSKAGFLGAVAARLARTPVVVYTPHGHIFGKAARIPGVHGAFRTALLLRLRRLAERWSDRVVALNRHDLDEQVALGLAPRHKYVVIPNGIDLAVYEASPRGDVRRDLDLDRDAFVIAVVGRLTTEKGQDVLVRAVAGLPERQRPILMIVGGGPREMALRDLGRTLRIAERIRFLGVRTDVPDLLRAANLLVLPSHYESGGLALMEAMAAGRPVIASRTGGVPDLVQDGEEGLLVPPGDPGALTEAIRRVMEDPDLADRLGTAGREKVRRDHDIRRTTTILQGLYTQLLSEKGVR
jgi:glycosyltransferase involved in cell wall biosynthesis